MYDKVWTPWLRMTPMIALESKTDKIGSEAKAGPGLTMNLNVMNFGIIRMLNNAHDFQVKWKRINGEVRSTPDIQYLLNLIVKLSPNIEIDNTELFDFGDGKMRSFMSSLKLYIYF
jgi:hypothetical protein